MDPPVGDNYFLVDGDTSWPQYLEHGHRNGDKTVLFTCDGSINGSSSHDKIFV